MLIPTVLAISISDSPLVLPAVLIATIVVAPIPVANGQRLPAIFSEAREVS